MVKISRRCKAGKVFTAQHWLKRIAHRDNSHFFSTVGRLEAMLSPEEFNKDHDFGNKNWEVEAGMM